MNNIFILGFGRSGTTWISDIISKTTGELILFEPFHPSVTDLSKKLSYSHVHNGNSIMVRNYLNDVLSKQHRKMWLMRNHVPVRLEDISQNFLGEIWDNCGIIGFKEIRANFMIQWLRESFPSKIIYIVRHPAAVVSSILKRRNFWEFGWPETYELFLTKTIYDDQYKKHKITECIDRVARAMTNVERYAIMWAITHSIVLPELERLGLPLFYYEDFYNNPFYFVRNLLNYLGLQRKSIHPAHIFTPSMTTLKTLHGIYDLEEPIHTKGARIFWEDTISTNELDTVMNIVDSFGIKIYDKSGFPVR